MTSREGSSDHEISLPSLAQLRDLTQKAFGTRPCFWQLQVTLAILQRDHDVISIAGTGMGKTLTFWMPLLVKHSRSIQIIVTPLNILGKQNIQTLEKAGIKGIFIGSDSATAENFQAIENLHYQAIVISPEQLMKPDGGFERLARNRVFIERVISIILDEAQCISAWGAFRPEYREIPIMLASALVFWFVL
ncbi:hypothetical protein H0H92_007873 [Tricholoma furcatifolium]|nr:hypothetical protein H0H92_007873 [Tricholoma furcatifolium]